MAPSRDDAASLIEAERAFAAQSMASDMASAFLAHFADDGVMLGRGWVTARAAFQGQPPPPVALDWAPAHVEVAASGELGLSTGPWIRKSRANPAAPAAHGHFVSIWRRQADGRWKVEVDLGVSHPHAVALPANVEVVAPSPRESSNTLEDAEARFVAASMLEGARAAYATHALPRLRLYREGHPPYRGKASALPALDERRTLWLADARVVSAANDFGYVRGTYADAADPEKVRGYFLRVWRRDAAGWGIALDVAKAAP